MKPTRVVVVVSLFLLLVLQAGRSLAFDVVDEKTGFISSRYLTFGVGLGFTGFARQAGVSGDMGVGLRLSAGHQFNRYLFAELGYQLSTFRWKTPDPIAPTTATLDTRAAMNFEYLRAVLLYPNWIVQPFVSLGVGMYNLFGVNRETGLAFPINFSIPVGAGLRAFLIRDILSLEAGFDYQFLFGENQSADTLAVLGLSKVNFDTYSMMFTFTALLF